MKALLIVFCLVVFCLGIFVSPAPSLAADLNNDGLDDTYNSASIVTNLEVGNIAVVDTGEGVVWDYVNRISALGYTVTTIAEGSPLEILLNYAVVILPVGHANVTHYNNFDGLADDYHMYVNAGGGLWVGQPNPFNMPGGTADITWVPYALTVQAGYTSADCPALIFDPTHCITQGQPTTNFSFPADNAENYASAWQVLVVGGSTGRPSVMYAEYGAGKILVELGHPSTSSICAMDDAAIERYLECLDSGTVATSETSWDSIKASFR